jgi:hypothetical protein
MNYQEAGQLLGDCLRHWAGTVFGEKVCGSDSKTGRWFCTNNTQKLKFACFLSEIEAEF